MPTAIYYNPPPPPPPPEPTLAERIAIAEEEARRQSLNRNPSDYQIALANAIQSGNYCMVWGKGGASWTSSDTDVQVGIDCYWQGEKRDPLITMSYGKSDYWFPATLFQQETQNYFLDERDAIDRGYLKPREGVKLPPYYDLYRKELDVQLSESRMMEERLASHEDYLANLDLQFTDFRIMPQAAEVLEKKKSPLWLALGAAVGLYVVTRK